MTWSVSHKDQVTTIRIDCKRVDGWTQWFLLSSDRHHDNPKCRQDLEKKHLDEAVSKDAIILDFGDLFCAMQGKWDKRASKDEIRPENNNGRYLESLVHCASDFYGPYAKHFALIGKCNHETSVAKRHEVCLTSMLVDRLNAKHKSNIVVGGYSGWVKIMFEHEKNRYSTLLFYDHGYGGGGPVTRDVIQTSRRAVYLPDAQIVVSGHTHDHFVLPISRERINSAGRRYRDEQLHIKTPTYKDGWNPSGNWEKERGMPPKPLGAVWLRMTYKRVPDSFEYDAFWAK